MEVEEGAPNMMAGEGPASGVLPNQRKDSAAMPTTAGPNAIVPQLLTESNYEYWSTSVKLYLVAQDLWEICTMKREDIPNKSQDSKAYSLWRKKNAKALHAIIISCSPGVLSRIWGIKNASEAWNILEQFCNPHAVTQVSTGKGDLFQYEKLRKDLERGNWKDIEIFLKSNPDAVRAKISKGMTPLHLAARAGYVNVVEKLVDKLNQEDLEIIDDRRNTPLSTAALGGNIGAVKHIIRKHKDLASNTSIGNKVLPVVFACGQGEEEMTRFLYSHTKSDALPQGPNGATLLKYSIACKFLDIALDIVKKHPHLAIERDLDGVTPLYALAQMTDWFKGGSQLWFWQRWIYACITINTDSALDRLHVTVEDDTEQSQSCGNKTRKVLHFIVHGLVSYPQEVLGIKKIRAQKLRNAQAKELLQAICAKLKEMYFEREVGVPVHQAVIEAVKHGNDKFVKELIKSLPELMWHFDNDGRNIFSIAAVHRHEKIFDLLAELPNKKRLQYDIDKSNNTGLHLAAMLAPPDRLHGISGPALQMQREIRWFKEMESIVPQNCKGFKNKENKTPSQLFTEQHATLVKEGERWMKAIATSSSVVAALVVTVMFAAAFTVPGGNNDNGAPIFLDDKYFMVFIISDSVSLFSAATSVLMFLGILTSEYTENKFLKVLPGELIIGLSSLFISLAAMMITFCAALAIVLKESSNKVVMVPNIVLACTPVAIFAGLQFPLLVRLCISTYGPAIFSKKIQRWS